VRQTRTRRCKVKATGVVILAVVFMVVCGAGGLLAQQTGEPAARASEEKVEGLKSEVAKSPEEPAVVTTGSIGFYNQYMFRGYQIGKDSLIIQPSLSASYRGFSASFWGNIDTHEKATQNFTPDRPGRTSFNEADLTLSYTYVVNKWSFTGGYIYYNTKYMDETQEFYGSVSWDVFAKPTLSIYRDVASYPGWYINLSLAQSFKIYKEVSLDLGAGVSYALGTGSFWDTYQASTGAYTGSKYSAFHSGMLSAGLTIPVTKKFSVQPMLAWWFPLSSDAKKRVDGNSYNPAGYLKYLWQGGVNCTYNF
jgi:hypothetical protein